MSVRNPGCVFDGQTKTNTQKESRHYIDYGSLASMQRSSRFFLGLLPLMAIAATGEGVAGKVLQDHTGTPLSSADVRIHKVGQRQLAADLETDDAGKFSAPTLGRGDYRIEFAKTGFVSAFLTLHIGSADPVSLLARLPRCGLISGRVMTTAGQPLKGAFVRVVSKIASGPQFRDSALRATTDEEGRYRLFNLGLGEYAVVVSYGASANAVAQSGHVPPGSGLGSGAQFYPSNARPEIFTISGGEEFRNVDFNLAPTALVSVSGQVAGSGPRTQFWVALAPIDQPGLATAVVPAGDDGQFKLDGIPAGSYHLFATGPVRGRSFMGAVLTDAPLFARQRVEVGGQDIAGLAIAPQPGVSATVRLQPAPGSEQACPAAASVGVLNIEDWAAMLQQDIRVTRQQPATIRNLAPGRYQLLARDLGENCYQSGEAILDLTGTEPATVAIPLAAAGSIRAHVTGAGAGEFAVFLLKAASSAGPAIRFVLTDADGRATFDTLPPGRYRIGVRRVSDPQRLRWIGETNRLVETDVQGGASTDLELSAPAVEKE